MFQKLANWIRGWKLPEGVKDFLGEIQLFFDGEVRRLVKQIGDEILRSIRAAIIEANRTDMSNKDKFDYVFNNVWKEYGSKEFLTTSLLNFAIELVFSLLKRQKFI